MVELLLIRHARPVSLFGARGQPDPELAPEGLAQVDALVAALAHQPIIAIWSSPLSRARQTAEPIARQRGLDIVSDLDLVEMSLGEDHYVPIDTRGPRAAVSQQMLATAMAFLATDDGQVQVLAFRRRVATAMRRITSAHASGAVAVVCHSGVINAVLTGLLGIEFPMTFQPDYTSISRVHLEPSGAGRVDSINEHGHVRALEHAAPDGGAR